jgi:hypothetical protein
MGINLENQWFVEESGLQANGHIAISKEKPVSIGELCADILLKTKLILNDSGT